MKPTSKNIVTTVKVKAREVNDLLLCFLLACCPNDFFFGICFHGLIDFFYPVLFFFCHIFFLFIFLYYHHCMKVNIIPENCIACICYLHAPDVFDYHDNGIVKFNNSDKLEKRIFFMINNKYVIFYHNSCMIKITNLKPELCYLFDYKITSFNYRDFN